MKINQKEIAKRAGVSQSTVSFVLNNREDIKISENTKIKILKIAEEFGYRRIFFRKDGFRTGNIGYIIPSTISIADPYYYRFYRGIFSGLTGKSLNLVIYNSENHHRITYMSDIFRNCDGLIIEEEIEEEIIEKIKEKIPIILLNTRTEKISIDYVMPDNKGGIIKAIKYLYEKGHRRIGIFGMKPMGLHQKERLLGYYEGMRIFGLKLIPEYISLPERKVGGIEEVKKYAEQTLRNWFGLREKPTAVVTFGDVYAISLVGVANKIGIKIPDELSVIGFDNIINCLYTDPPLTTIEHPIEEMGEKAVEILIEKVRNPNKKVEKVIFDVELIERESVKEVRI